MRTMLTEAAKGVFTISVTPFREDGSLDLDSLDRVTDFYIEQGATGLTVLGMMGEAGKLSADEAVQGPLNPKSVLCSAEPSVMHPRSAVAF